MAHTKAFMNEKGECVVVDMTAEEEALYEETIQSLSESMVITEQPQDDVELPDSP